MSQRRSPWWVRACLVATCCLASCGDDGPPPVTVTVPNGGELWIVGSSAPVRWSSAGAVGDVCIELSTDGGMTWPATLVASTSNDGSEMVTVPDLPSATCRVRVGGVDGGPDDASDADFEIVPLCGEFRLVSPADNAVGVPVTSALAWEDAANADTYTLEVDDDAGFSSPVVHEDSLTESTYAVGTEVLQSGITYYWRVAALNVAGSRAASNNDFSFTTLPPPSIEVTCPSAGEEWVVGELASVRWHSAAPSGNVKIELSVDSGQTWPTTLVSSTADDGAERVPVPDLPGTQCRIRVSGTGGEPSGAMHGDFTIRAWFTETYLVVDLTSGAVGEQADIADLTTNDEYKTFKLVLKRLEPGSFEMGDEVRGHSSDELPVHTVLLTRPAYLGVFEVTQRQWYEVLGSWPSHFSADREKRPVEWISWNACQGLASQLSSDTGLAIRLPTEAEWEYACKAGTSTNFSFGDVADGAYMWYFDNSDTGNGRETHQAGTKLPNPWGFYDMHGNVAERCQDRYSSSYYSVSPVENPQGPSLGDFRSWRSSGFNSYATNQRSSYRAYGSPEGYGSSLGLRVVVVP